MFSEIGVNISSYDQYQVLKLYKFVPLHHVGGSGYEIKVTSSKILSSIDKKNIIIILISLETKSILSLL